MKTFARHMESLTQICHSFCSSMFMVPTVVLVFVTIGLPQAALAQDLPVCPQTIKECCKIDKPGKYSLGQDLVLADTQTSQGCIGIVALSDVYLNLDGHTISGPRSPSRDLCVGTSPAPIGIVAGGSNIHIVGRSDAGGNKGTVKGFDQGIQVAASGGHLHLSELTLTENGIGLTLGSNDNHVSDSTISGNCHGVDLRANHNVIDSNKINDNNSVGLVLGGVNPDQIASDNTITSNTFFGNKNGVSIIVSGSNHNTIRGNTVLNNPANVLELGVGIDVLGNDNTIQSNIVSGNETGIQLELNASGNFVYGNTALGNALDLKDFNIPPNPPNCINTWTNNIFTTDSEGDGPRMGCIQ